MKSILSKDYKSPDNDTDGPFFSFSHLSSCFPHDKIDDGDQFANYGFLSPREDILYETGILFKSFMKC
ncbi:MAG: hypothetical protein CSYNP_00114 [Syntrophus sp. SKADARSKE-3]|nr:hypothetical protein [Syntrophus sp. SKADARSKE-3]